MALNRKNDRFLTGVIIAISIMGLLYFGLSAISEDSERNQENPFEYNIEIFKETGSEQVDYNEEITFPLNMSHPTGIAIGPEDDIFVAGDGQLHIFDKAGHLISKNITNGQVSSMAVDQNADVYLCIATHVEILDLTGTQKAQWQNLGGEAILTAIAVGENDVYVADAGQLIVWHFDKAGNLMGRIGEKDESKQIPGFLIPSPYFDVAIDPDGFLWAVNTGRHQFQNYTKEGDFRSSWARSSMKIDGFSGCCNPSHIAILPDGSFVTSEKGIPRVKIHNRLGDFVAVVAGSDQFDEDTVGLDLAVDSQERIIVLDPKRKQARIFQKKEKAA